MLTTARGASSIPWRKFPIKPPLSQHDLWSRRMRLHPIPLLVLCFGLCSGLSSSGRSILINELMYHPISENNLEEYVELFNAGTNSVNLAWSLSGGRGQRVSVYQSLPRGQQLCGWLGRNPQQQRPVA